MPGRFEEKGGAPLRRRKEERGGQWSSGNNHTLRAKPLSKEKSDKGKGRRGTRPRRQEETSSNFKLEWRRHCVGGNKEKGPARSWKVFLELNQRGGLELRDLEKDGVT